MKGAMAEPCVNTISEPSRHYVVTYPSSTPWIKLRTEHLRLRAIIEEGKS